MAFNKHIVKKSIELGDITGSSLPPLGASPDLLDVDDKTTVEALRHTWEHEYRIRLPHEHNWDRSFQRYNLDYDFSRKAPWQSKRVFPHYTVLCRKVAWELSKPVLTSTGKRFKATTDLNPWRDVADIAEEILEKQLGDRSSFAGPTFNDAWWKMAQMMAITGNGYLLILPEFKGEIDLRPAAAVSDSFEEIDEEEAPLSSLDLEDLPSLNALPDLGGEEPDEEVLTVDQMKKRFRIRVQALNPRDVVVDSANPDYPEFVMWRQRLTPHQFRRLARTHNWENVEEIIESARNTTNTDEEGKRKHRRDNKTADSARKKETITLYHYIGTLLDNKGEAVFENKYSSWAGERLVQRPQKLGLWHGQLPVVGGGMLERAFGAYHDSMAAINLDPQETQNEILNSLLDYLKQVINPPTEIDHDQLHQSVGASQLKSGTTPGGILHLQKMGRPYPAVARSAPPDMSQGVWQGVQAIKLALNETNGLSDIGAQPRTRNRITADEAQERMRMSQGIWQDAVLNIERKILRTAYTQMYLLGLQGVTDEEWRSMLEARIARHSAPVNPQQQVETADPDSSVKPTDSLLKKYEKMMKWDAKQRWRYFAATFAFEPQVFSAVDSRRRNLEKLDALMERAQVNPELMKSIRWRRLAEQYLLALEFDPNDLLFPDRGETAEAPVQPGMEAGGQIPGTPNSVGPVPPPPRPA